MRSKLLWLCLTFAITIPILASLASPLFAWRDATYIAAGLAGILGLTLLFVQPLLIGGYLPNLRTQISRRLHAFIGSSIVILVIAHVFGLWLTSPPDVIDALLFRSPTPFSNWGVIAMWAVFATGFLALFKKRLRMRPKQWRLVHIGLALVISIGSVVHALLIEGTMEPITKTMLCVLVMIATSKLAIDKFRVN